MFTVEGKNMKSKKTWHVCIRKGALHNEAQFNTDGHINTIKLGMGGNQDEAINAAQQWHRRGFVGYPPIART